MPGVFRSRAALGQRRAIRICRHAVNALLTVTLAPRCAACSHVLDSPLAGPICDGCWIQVRPLTPSFYCTGGDVLDAARAFGEYEPPLREILQAFKYEGRRGLAKPLGAMLRTAGTDILENADCVVPVPLHPWRRIRRGFNQAEDLARELAVPLVHALWRPLPTAPQAGLHAAARRRNVRGAFAISPFLSPASRESLLDASVVLVDDVRTTGATLDGCAMVLRDMGVRKVAALTVARATIRRGGPSGPPTVETTA